MGRIDMPLTKLEFHYVSMKSGLEGRNNYTQVFGRAYHYQSQ